jgi:ubiquinone/menaquinone biosynthesis C-methylase UbiE
MSKWGEKYARKADAFASTRAWREEAAIIIKRMDFRGKILLDFACNTGKFFQEVDRMSKNFAFKEYIGVDINADALTKAYRTVFLHPKYFTNTHVLESESVHYVVFMHAINQVEDLDATLQELWRVLKRGGLIAVVTHNPWHFRFFGFRNWFNGYKPDPTIIREPTKGELKQIMWDNGFICDETFWQGKGLIPFLKHRTFFFGRKGD